MNLYTGVVENRSDPLKLGRCQVRVVGLHTHDKIALPTDELPWAYPMQPITSAAISGIGQSPVGVVEGTWVIVMFRDEDLQQPIILGTIGGIPQAESRNVSEDLDDSIMVDSSQATITTQGTSVVTTETGATVTDGNGNPVIQGADNPTQALKDATLAVAPKGTGKLPGPAEQKGIDALNKAMDAAGFTGKYGRAALLAISGGECGWIPRSEDHVFRKPESLQAIFSTTFKNNRAAAEKYANWKGTKESFFDFVYAPQNNGALVGNTQPGDGGKFYGRGFIQLTGRPNYEKYARLSGIDIVNNPQLLNEDYEASARVAVAYFQDRVRMSPDNPGYLKEALPRVGADANGTGYPKKEYYYNYFLGEPVPPPTQTDKSTVPGQQSQGVPINSSGLPVDREQNLVLGFTDPNMKYPLRQYIGEPDTNRLARGKITGTIVEFKDDKRLEEVATAGGFKWSQPDIPFNAKYPFNKVMESESGHIMEFDDTPENERIHMYHRKGTYTEIDCNGTQVNRIVGDNYSIVERNGYIVIAGQCNVTVTGAAKILVQNDAHIQVEGNTKMDMKGNADFGVAGDFNIVAGGAFKVKSNGMFLDSSGSTNIFSTGSTNITSNASIEAFSTGRISLQGSTIDVQVGANKAEKSSLGDAPAKGNKSSIVFEQQKTPPRNLEEEVAYETPEENVGAAAAAYHSDRTTDKPKDPVNAGEELAKPQNDIVATKTDCKLIYGMPSFPDSYVLHTDSTGYKWTVGFMRNGHTLTSGRYVAGLRGEMKEMSVQELVCNLHALAVNIGGPLNEAMGKVGKAWQMTSCYRNDKPPKGGVNNSQHASASAIDISPGGNYAYKLNYDWATKLSAILPYDQMLLEYRDPGVNGNKNPKRINWIHISFNNYGPPHKDLRTFKNDTTYAANSLVLLT